MRINGRTLRASTIAERRLLRSLGVEALHVPRRENPFRVARKVEQIIRRQEEELILLRSLAQGHQPREPKPSPDVDLPFTQEHEEHEDVCA